MSIIESVLPDWEQWQVPIRHGALVTIQISIGAFVVGMLIGIVAALAKLSGGPLAKRIANLYTTICRAIPELLLILLLYYAGTDALNGLLAAMGISSIEIDGYLAAIIVLGIVQGAYSSEILRAAILAVPAGQLEAATAIGFSRTTIFYRILLPAMAPVALPGIANLWISLIKDSALISVVGFGELMQAGKQAAGATKSYMAYYLAIGAVYLCMTLVSTQVFRLFERRTSRWRPSTV